MLAGVKQEMHPHTKMEVSGSRLSKVKSPNMNTDNMLPLHIAVVKSI